MPGVLVNSRMSRPIREGKEKKKRKVAGHPENLPAAHQNRPHPDALLPTPQEGDHHVDDHL